MRFAAVTSLLVILSVSPAWGQGNRREPHVGYLYPAGGQEGAVVWVVAGGQNLRGVSALHVTGEGVSLQSIRYAGRFRRLNREQRRELERRLKEVRGTLDPGEEKKGDVEGILPNHPLLRDLENLSERELEFVEHGFLRYDRRKQPNAQIGELVLMEIAIDAGATPGDREIRLRTPMGLSNPICFQVGLLPEVSEPKPYDVRGDDTPPVDLPVRLNGQIKPGDVDRFCFQAQKGQRLVIQAHARHLVPFLADAVPGWFQATLALFDSGDREVAFADDYRLDPDPVLFYEVPKTGIYKVEIRDSIYRGREDFVYRITVGEQPFIRSVYPLGGRLGEVTVASIDGWNLETRRLPLDTGEGRGPVRTVAMRQEDGVTNNVTYAVGDLPECGEVEPNDTREAAQGIDLPRIVNGRIGESGDLDIFRFEGKGGEEVVAQVMGRRLDSPIDSVVRLSDSTGRLLAWNDDHVHKEGHLHKDMGLITHHADSYLLARLPQDGTYYVEMADSQNHGGEEWAYRLQIAPPRPDFALAVTPSSVNLRGGGATVITVHASRKEGFNGEIQVSLKDPPPGFGLQGGRIPPGRDRIRMTLTASRESPREPVTLQMEGIARIQGREVRRPAAASEEMMQAFLYRHLVPTRELVATVTGPRARPARSTPDLKARIPVRGSTEMRYPVPRLLPVENLRLKLSDPPEGVILQDVTVSPGEISFVLVSTGDALPVGFEDNLIIEASGEPTAQRRGGKGRKRNQRVPLGVLPAIPLEIVEP